MLAAVMLLGLCSCGRTESGTLRVWVCSADYAEQMNRAFAADNPAVRWDIEYTVYSLDELDEMLAEARQEDALPDVLMLAPDNLAQYVESGTLADLGALGITTDKENSYAYTLSGCSDESGTVRAVCWQPDPVLFFYRRSMAYVYLGTDDPIQIGQMIGDWGGFLDTARIVHSASGGSARMTAGLDELLSIYLSGMGNSWFDENGAVVMSDAALAGMEYARILSQEELTYGFEQWSEGWIKGISDSASVFGYFTSAIGMEHILKPACGGTVPGQGSFGDWAVTVGPASCNLGGCWLSVTDSGSMKEEAALFVGYFTCETEAMRRYCLQNGQFSANRTVVDQIKYDQQFSEKFLAGQNYYCELAAAAQLIGTAQRTQYDSLLDIEYVSAAADYAAGLCTLEEACARFLQAAQMIVQQ